MTAPPIYIDATMMYRWKHLAPVGIVRLERLLASHLRFTSDLAPPHYVLWDGGYRPTDSAETRMLDELLDPASVDRRSRSTDDGRLPDSTERAASTPSPSRRVVSRLRSVGVRTIDRLPEHLRPFAEQAAWSAATLAVESARHVRRARHRRGLGSGAAGRSEVAHRIDLTLGGDLVAMGLGWEYIDHEAMYRLARDHGIRIHMPAFDLIPIDLPQMNAGQSHLVHRFYADMAHYADSVTSISQATTAALGSFYDRESLPRPFLATNPLPGIDPTAGAESGDRRGRRHRLEGEPFVLTVSTVEIRKNHLLLAKVWAECAREGIDLPRLAIVGRVGWDVAELLRWVEHDPTLTDRVTILTDVEDDELVNMYKDATFTVFPSRIEGWGLPITEALTYGKVCIHSIDPAQREAAQDLMPALHPDDFLGWKREIVRVAHDTPYREQLERTVRDRYRPRTTREYCDDFESILRSRRGADA